MTNMIHTVLQHLTSTPEPEPDESDYEVSLPSISQRVVSKRQHNTSTSTPLRSRIPTRSNTPRSASRSSRSSTPLKHQVLSSSLPGQDNEREKIKEFVDVKKMIIAMRSLESLVSSPEVDYDSFKEEYVLSTKQLVEAVYSPQEGLQAAVPTPTATKANALKTDDNQDIIMGIFMVSMQIGKLCLEMGTPLLIQLTVFWTEMMRKPFVTQLVTLGGEIVLITLSLVLDLLKRLKRWLNN